MLEKARQRLSDWMERFDELISELLRLHPTSDTSLIKTNPGKGDIVKMLAKAKSLLDDNHGIRVSKLYNPKTREVLIMAWPASGWLHNDLKTALMRSKHQYRQIEGEAGNKDFDYIDDAKNKRFSDQELEKIMQWIKAPIDIPQEDGNNPQS